MNALTIPSRLSTHGMARGYVRGGGEDAVSRWCAYIRTRNPRAYIPYDLVAFLVLVLVPSTPPPIPSRFGATAES